MQIQPRLVSAALLQSMVVYADPNKVGFLQIFSESIWQPTTVDALACGAMKNGAGSDKDTQSA